MCGHCGSCVYALRCTIRLFGVCERARQIANLFRRFFLLLLQESIASVNVPSVCAQHSVAPEAYLRHYRQQREG